MSAKFDQKDKWCKMTAAGENNESTNPTIYGVVSE